MNGKRFINYITKQKSWYHNLLGIVSDYKHRSEENDMYLIHMNDRCRLDRVGCYSSIWRWRWR